MENNEVTKAEGTESGKRITILEGSELRSLQALRIVALVLQGALNDLLTVGPAEGRASDGSYPDEIEKAKAKTWAPVNSALRHLQSILAMIREEVCSPPTENLLKLVDTLNATIAQLEEQGEAKLHLEYGAKLERQLAKAGSGRRPALAGTRLSRLRQSLSEIFPAYEA
ncbi:MAG TPA: hypothetical protein VKJ45_16970 [Blastocatellia bacterium]|nr:hypothetical protein [Blastocatellia bacterium]